ncbi:Homeobox protein KNOX3 [Hordeum vulgare]|nr:Homeobox protein KNOX3 [Hordeum vulgare]
MAERFPSDGAAANGFDRRFLHEWEARLLQEANYPPPPEMCVSGAWWLRAGSVPVPSSPFGMERDTEIAWIQESLPEDVCQQPRYAPDNQPLWTAYFQRCHAEQLASINGARALRGRHSFDGHHQ